VLPVLNSQKLKNAKLKKPSFLGREIFELSKIHPSL